MKAIILVMGFGECIWIRHGFVSKAWNSLGWGWGLLIWLGTIPLCTYGDDYMYVLDDLK